MNAVMAANERAPLQDAIPESSLDATSPAAEPETMRGIEARLARTETVTAALADILRSETRLNWRKT